MVARGAAECDDRICFALWARAIIACDWGEKGAHGIGLQKVSVRSNWATGAKRRETRQRVCGYDHITASSKT